MLYIILMIQLNIFKYGFFSKFIQILLNYVLNEFLRQGYTLYGMPPLLFPHPTTPGDPSTPQVDSTHVSETTIYFVFKP
jgi:hypothetical protein